MKIPVVIDESLNNWNPDAIFQGPDGHQYRKDKSVGLIAFCENEGKITHLRYMCPCGCGNWACIPITTEPGGYGWQWNGNKEKPTLNPSIQKLTPCHWHGFLVDGCFESC